MSARTGQRSVEYVYTRVNWPEPSTLQAGLVSRIDPITAEKFRYRISKCREFLRQNQWANEVIIKWPFKYKVYPGNILDHKTIIDEDDFKDLWFSHLNYTHPLKMGEPQIREFSCVVYKTDTYASVIEEYEGEASAFLGGW